MASTTSGDSLPTGSKIFSTIPDVFFIPEFVMSYVATLLYFIHAIFSAIRWRRS
ncbi:myelin and lymphocyte protein isoform X2 [Echeneis naucrates]|uniref:myelin and lymphocyte protein isoform X2 n=1 Tax=Echeneis naucrates TaxID=173247 RepID=UPI00111407A5|nr:myelin and lymphocyte protein isoform X2 [Echeneis naucrates]